MREHADPPVSFGGSGGIVWPLGPNAHAQIPATRRPRTDPSAPSALRLRASGPAVTLAACGRRVDPREWADPPPGLELAAPDLPTLPEIAVDRRETENDDEDRGDASSSSDADADDLPTFEDHRVSFEATEAQSSMDATHAFPVGIPRRVMKARLRESKRDAADDQNATFVRRLGNALAVAPWPRDGTPRDRAEVALDSYADVMLARATGEGAARVRIARLKREGFQTRHPGEDGERGTKTRGEGVEETYANKKALFPRLCVLADFPLPLRAASQPVLQVELSRVSHGWLKRFEDDAQPALCAARDPYGVSLSVLGGGVSRVPVPGRKRTLRQKFASSRPNYSAPIDASPDPELLWSCAWNAPASAPADIKLSPHGLPELLVASKDGGLRVVDAAACDAAGGVRKMKKKTKTKRALRDAARVAATPAATFTGADTFPNWCGCAYGSNPRVALLATSKLVRSVDLRVKPSFGTFLAEPVYGDNPWRALAGPPVAAWSPSSFSFSSPFASSSVALENAFALACDRTVALYDIRKPNAPVARWAHGAAAAPAWLRLEPSAPWRDAFSSPGSGGDHASVTSLAKKNTEKQLGALVLLGLGGEDGGVLAFEWAERPEEALDGSLSGGVRALGAGARVPLDENEKHTFSTGTQGFAMLPPVAGTVPGGTLWATRDGRVRWRGYDPAPRGTDGAVSPAAPLAFDAGDARADGEAPGPRTVPETVPENETDHAAFFDALDAGDTVPVPSELTRACGAAAGVSAMDPPRASLGDMDDAARAAFDAATARAAAEGAARADRASRRAPHPPEEGAAADSFDSRTEDGRVVKKKTTFPLVAGFIARGAVPGEVEREEEKEKSPAAEADAEKKALARAAALVRAAGGFGVTTHELALLASRARGDGGGAADVAEWLASRDLAGRKRRLDADARKRARDDALAFFPEPSEPPNERVHVREEDVEGVEGVLPLERTPVRVGRAFPGWDRDRPTRDETHLSSRETSRLLAAVVGAGDDDDASRDAPHTAWLRGSARWIGADAQSLGRTTYTLRSPEPAKNDRRAERSLRAESDKSAAAARAALLESWPDPSASLETTTPAARRAKGNESSRSPFRLESRLKKPRGASDAPRAARDGRRVSWDVPAAPPRANAATPRTEPRKKTKKKARARREDGF